MRTTCCGMGGMGGQRCQDCPLTVPITTNLNWPPAGWICPKCGAGKAPWVTECKHDQHYPARQEVT